LFAVFVAAVRVVIDAVLSYSYLVYAAKSRDRGASQVAMRRYIASYPPVCIGFACRSVTSVKGGASAAAERGTEGGERERETESRGREQKIKERGG